MMVIMMMAALTMTMMMIWMAFKNRDDADAQRECKGKVQNIFLKKVEIKCFIWEDFLHLPLTPFPEKGACVLCIRTSSQASKLR